MTFWIAPVLFILAAASSRGQAPNKLLAHWNAPQAVIPARSNRSEPVQVVQLRDASQFRMPDGSRVQQGFLTDDRSTLFFLAVQGKSVQVSFKPDYRPDGSPSGGTFRLLATMCGGPVSEFEKNSPAEKLLVGFMRNALAGLIGKDDVEQRSKGAPEPALCWSVEGGASHGG